ncbi:hypothetical protein STIUS_v1c01370 [Spiroplasma sp. TIUS-1]|uniref:HAD-IIB family hydrolase n=1 Tax=Spiroplasma sp. TIUS-1 TaxID=216963 RepID=UPI0013986BB7|nr:HAD family hydrolase [Spiroplasma sp. TIUS-1]QHX35692.1 hypothetical protein STIUS_v1c01370 [Spiroplasma sp. TIUS-1]
MSKVKLLILDLDGTCHKMGGGPHPNNFEAIKKAHDEYGINVVFATGRANHSKYNEFIKLGDISKGNYFLAAFNGAYIENMSNKTLLEENPIPSNLTKWLWNYINKEDRFSAVSYIHNSRDVISSKDNLLVQRVLHFNNPDFEVHSPYEKEEFPETYKFVVKHFTQVDKEILEEKGFHVQWEPSSDTAEINFQDINKGYVVDYFCKKLDINHSEVLAMGDGSNDVESLKKAGYGICPVNSGPAAKSAANRISNYTDAESCVARTIEELVFNKN